MGPVVLQRLQSALERNFFDDFNFKPKQILCLQHLIHGHDVIAVLPTGFGKNFLFQVLPDILPGKNNIVVVVCPLNSIIEDQMNSLKKLNIPCDVLRSETQNHIIPLLFKANVRNKNVDDFVGTEEDFSLLRDIIVNGSLKILFCHPEAILSERGRLLMNSTTYQENVAACVIDEAHCVDMWGKEFRKDFSELSSLKAFFPNIPFLCLTATAPPCNTNILINTLKLNGCKVIRANPNRRNVYLDKCYRLDKVYGFQSYEEILIPIMNNLKVLRNRYPVTIIYMKLRYCGESYSLFDRFLGKEQYVDGKTIPSHRLFAQFHAPQTREMKSTILSELKKEESNIRVVFATMALGMGVDAKFVTHVIHISPPSNLESDTQEIGRAGRMGQCSKATLYFCNSDLSEDKIRKGYINDSMKKFCFNVDVCQRKILLDYFGIKDSEFQEKCCCICDNTFIMKNATILGNKSLPYRSISNENLQILKCQLKKYACSVKNKFDLLTMSYDNSFNESCVAVILEKIAFIKDEKDLDYLCGVWDANHAIAIYQLISDLTTLI